MNLIKRIGGLFTKSSFTPSSYERSVHGGGGISSHAGEPVSERNALSLSAVWACVNLISGTIGSLPLNVYKREKDGSRTVLRDHAIHRILHESPNADQTPIDVLESISTSLELRGNGYSDKVFGSQGQLVGLVPIRPDLVSVRRDSNRLKYSWSENGRSHTRDQSQMLHIRGFGGDALGGLSTIAFGRHTFGLASAIDRSAGKVFANAMRPSGVLTFEDWIPKEKREEVRKALTDQFVGAHNVGRPLVLEGKSAWKQLQINPEDAQMLESRGFSVEDVCRFFGVPPFMVGHSDGSSNWGTGLEQQVLAFQKFTLRRRLKRIEQALCKQLLTPQDRAAGIFIEFNLDGLLRGDSAARSAFYGSALNNGWMTINEVRALENLPPVPGGDEPRMQMQNVPITQAGKPEVSP